MAILSAKCIVPSHHKAGLLGWTLYYQDVGSAFEQGELQDDLDSYLLHRLSTFSSQIVAEGNDLEERGICKIQTRQNTWAKGIYLLKVRCFYHKGLVPLAAGKETWILKADSEILSCGGYNDVRPAIALA